jgi:hypothetical protein
MRILVGTRSDGGDGEEAATIAALHKSRHRKHSENKKSSLHKPTSHAAAMPLPYQSFSHGIGKLNLARLSLTQALCKKGFQPRLHSLCLVSTLLLHLLLQRFQVLLKDLAGYGEIFQAKENCGVRRSGVSLVCFITVSVVYKASSAQLRKL